MSKFKLFLATLIFSSTAFCFESTAIFLMMTSAANSIGDVHTNVDKLILENAKDDAIQFILSPEETKVPTPALEAAMKLVQQERDLQNLPQASAIELAVEVLERAEAAQNQESLY